MGWVEASYTAIHHVLTNPVYAGAYSNGRTRQEIESDCEAALKQWRLGVERASYEAQRAQRPLRLERRTVLFRIRFMSCSCAIGAF